MFIEYLLCASCLPGPEDMGQTWFLPSWSSLATILPHLVPSPAPLLVLGPLPSSRWAHISHLAPMGNGKWLPGLPTTPLWAWFPLQSSAWSLLFLGRFMCISHLAQGAQDGRNNGVTRRTGRKSGLSGRKDSAQGLTASGLPWNEQGHACLGEKENHRPRKV